MLGEGRADLSRLQSVFGLVRAYGGSEQFAWACSSQSVSRSLIGVTWLWRSRMAFDLKAAALAAGTLVATPYLYMYDLVVLAVAVAFLLRFVLERGFFASEISASAAAGALILSFPFVKTQVGLAAVLIVILLVATAGRSFYRHRAKVFMLHCNKIHATLK